MRRSPGKPRANTVRLSPFSHSTVISPGYAHITGSGEQARGTQHQSLPVRSLPSRSRDNTDTQLLVKERSKFLGALMHLIFIQVETCW